MSPLVSVWGAPSDILSHLKGEWTFHRRADGRDLMIGVAVFSPSEDGSLIYRESGRATMADGQSFDAERRYIFRAHGDGFSVFFMENPPRLFHDITLIATHDELDGEARHLCIDDLYLSRYKFLPNGTFTTRHDVTGPRKNYILETLYSRAA